MDKEQNENNEIFNTVHYLNVQGRDTLYPGSYTLESGYVSSDTVMNIPAFYAGVRLLSGRLAPLPKELKQSSKGKIVEIDEHPLLVTLNRKPNQYAGPTTTFETMWYHVFVYGNGYLYVKRSGRTVELINLNPQEVVPFRFDGVKYFYLQREGAVLTNDEVIHVVGLSFDGISGINPIQLLSDTFERMQTIQSFQVKYFRNGTSISGTIEVPAALTKEQLATMKEAIGDNMTGARNAGKIPILPFGAKLVNSTASNESSQLAELAKLSVNEAERILGLPAGILSGPHNLYEAGLRTALKQHINKLEEELDKLLSLSEFNKGYYFKLNLSTNAIEITDMNGLILAANAGLINPNEARDMMDREPYEGGDNFRVPVAISQPMPSENNPTDPKQPIGGTGAGEASGAGETATNPNYSAVAPLILSAIERVERKATKAFGSHQDKWSQKYLAWKHNRFCIEQSAYLRDSLQPVAQTYTALSGKQVDIEPLVEEYKNAIYSLNAGEEFSFDLQDKITGIFS